MIYVQITQSSCKNKQKSLSFHSSVVIHSTYVHIKWKKIKYCINSFVSSEIEKVSLHIHKGTYIFCKITVKTLSYFLWNILNNSEFWGS